MYKIKYRITNIVALTTTNQRLDLNLLKENLANVKYSPEKYDGLIYKVINPKVTVLINWSGKLIIVGGTSIKNTRKARDLFYDDIRKQGYDPQPNDIIIKNIVLIANVGTRLNLERIFESNMRPDLECELEIFPGLIFKNKNPRFTAVIFKSGKIIIAGLKNMKDMPSCIQILQELLDNQ